MPYKKIILRNGLLQIEKYFGTIAYEDILMGDTEAYDIKLNSDEKFLMLADVSEATFPNISLDQFEELFDIVNKFSATTNGMRHAFYIGNMEYEDFMKVNHYLQMANHKALSMSSFTTINKAYEWLNLSENEINEINAFLFND